MNYEDELVFKYNQLGTQLNHVRPLQEMLYQYLGILINERNAILRIAKASGYDMERFNQ